MTASAISMQDPLSHGRRNFKQQSLNVVFTGHFCSGWCCNFVGLVRNRVLNSCRIWSTTQLTSHPPPPPHSHKVSVYTVNLLWEGGEGGGGQREGRGPTLHKYNSFVHGGNSSQAESKIPTMSECITSL
jgi:hypothetical protein